MIYIAGMTIAVFFEILLMTKKDKSEPDKILALWMFLITVHLFLFYLFFTGNIYDYPFLLGSGLPLPLLQSVFLYLYVSSVTNQQPANRKLLLLHFVPAAAMYLYLVDFFLLPAEQKILVFRNQGAGYEVFNAIRSAAINLSGIVYVVWTSLLLRNHRRRILDLYSYRQKVDLQWLRILIWGIGGIWLFAFFTEDTIIFGGVVVFVFLIGFFGIRQIRIFPGEPALVSPAPASSVTPAEEPTEAQQIKLEDSPETAGAPGRGKYAKSGLTAEAADQLYAELLRLMKQEAVYTRNDLALDDLASRLKAHPNYLSQIINEKEGKNFYDFVNSYRLEAFKRLLSDPKKRNFTLLSLAYECGFNSKSSFNRHFKKVTGQTPSEYFAKVVPQ